MDDKTPGPVEYVEAEIIEPGGLATAFPEQGEMPAGGYRRSGPSCCGGCGVVGLILAAVVVWNPGNIVAGVAIAVGSFLLAGWFLRMAGLHKFGPSYVFLFPPLLFMSMNLVAKVVSGKFIFSAWELLIWSAGATILLFLARTGLQNWIRKAGMQFPVRRY